MSNELDATAGSPGSDAEKGIENASKQASEQDVQEASAPGSVATPNPTSPAPGAAPRKQLKSKKLDRTLQELESAFSNWESLNDTQVDAAVEQEPRKPKEATVAEEEFRKRTKMLLHQLRQQLADFSND